MSQIRGAATEMIMMYMEQETYFNSDHICPSIILLSLKRYAVMQESWYVISRRMDDYRDLTDENDMQRMN